MDDITLTALKGSIAKWDAIAGGTGIDGGIEDCPLCDVFYKKSCAGCPVRKKTGRSQCVGSPYEAWRMVASEPYSKASTPERVELAKVEANFLRSLLPCPEVSPLNAIVHDAGRKMQTLQMARIVPGLYPEKSDADALIADLEALWQIWDPVIQAIGEYAAQTIGVSQRDVKEHFTDVVRNALDGNATYDLEAAVIAARAMAENAP